MLPAKGSPDKQRSALKRKDDRIIIHFDYDCFYASVFEAEEPALRFLPLAVKQKQIIVTCNYEARRRGLYKLQLITEAKKKCPEVIIKLGEDISRFRDASKVLYTFLRSFSWNGKVERLGFDEVWLDVTDIINFNIALLNPHDLANSFFCLSKQDPTAGFTFDATSIAGHAYPKRADVPNLEDLAGQGAIAMLYLRLLLGSHLAKHIRVSLEAQGGYTSTVGISTSKLLSKLVGNVNKPNGQTTLLPPYLDDGVRPGTVNVFIDAHEVGKIPGIGFKLATRIRSHVLQKTIEYDQGLVTGRTKDTVQCGDVRATPGISAEVLEHVLAGPGSPFGIGAKIWGLVNGIDDSEVHQAREVPRQISIEDSYIRLDTMEQVLKELSMLARRIIERMQIDLIEEEPHEASLSDQQQQASTDILPLRRRWLAHPKTIRLSTRPRPPRNPDGTRSRSFARMSRSAPLPNFVFSLNEDIESLGQRLVSEGLVPMFRKLHPEPSGWDLSLVNVAVTNMAEAASDKSAAASGRDIERMFRRQEDVLRDWKVEDRDVPPDSPDHYDLSNAADLKVTAPAHEGLESEGTSSSTTLAKSLPASFQRHGSEDYPTGTQESHEELMLIDSWDDEDEPRQEDAVVCDLCSARMPLFALAAHERYHMAKD